MSILIANKSNNNEIVSGGGGLKSKFIQVLKSSKVRYLR